MKTPTNRTCLMGGIASLGLLASTGATTLLVDIQGTGGLASTVADFQANDPNVESGATVNTVTSLGSTSISPFTVDLTGGGGLFNTINGAANDDLPIIDGYWWAFGAVGTRTMTVTGLSGIATGQTITVVLYGASDSDTAITTFSPTYDGTGLGDQNSPLTGSRSVSYSFTATGADTLTVNWGKTGGTGGAGFGGFSLISVPEPSIALLGSLGLIGLARRRRH